MVPSFLSRSQQRLTDPRRAGAESRSRSWNGRRVAEDLEEVPWSNVNTETVADEPVIASAESSTVGDSEGDEAMDYFKKLATE